MTAAAPARSAAAAISAPSVGPVPAAAITGLPPAASTVAATISFDSDGVSAKISPVPLGATIAETGESARIEALVRTASRSTEPSAA